MANVTAETETSASSARSWRGAASNAARVALLAAALAVALFTADPALAASTTYGDSGPMERCFAAARAARPDDAAIRDCDEALTKPNLSNHDRINTTVNRGVLQLQRRNGEAALADFDTVIALDPRNAEAHLNRGAALVMLHRPGLAVAAITTALSYGVSAPHKAYFNRAAAREAMGDVRGAYEDYNTALTIRPDWGEAEAELARFARGRRERLAAQLADPPTPSQGN